MNANTVRASAPQAQAKKRGSNKQNRAKLIVRDDQVPDGVLAWTSKDVEKWRHDFMTAFRGRPAPLCLALEVLPHVPQRGYCWRNNEYLVTQTGLGRSNFFGALAAIVEQGFFIVGYCGDERRIWLANPTIESWQPGLACPGSSPDNPDSRVPITRTPESRQPGLVSPGNQDSPIILENFRDSAEKEESPSEPNSGQEEATDGKDITDYDFFELKALAPPIRRTGEHECLTDEETAFVAMLPLRLLGHDDIRLLGNHTAAYYAYKRRVEHNWRQDWRDEEFDWRPQPPAEFWAEWRNDKPALKAQGYEVRPTDSGAYEYRRQRRAAA